MERSREAQEGEEARKYGNEPDPFDIMYGDASHRYVDTKLKTRASTRDTWITVTLSCVKRTPLMLRENATRFMGGRVALKRPSTKDAFEFYADVFCMRNNRVTSVHSNREECEKKKKKAKRDSMHRNVRCSYRGRSNRWGRGILKNFLRIRELFTGFLEILLFLESLKFSKYLEFQNSINSASKKF